MTGGEGTAEMTANMLMATGVLIAAVVALVIVGFVVYKRTAADRESS